MPKSIPSLPEKRVCLQPMRHVRVDASTSHRTARIEMQWVKKNPGRPCPRRRAACMRLFLQGMAKRLRLGVEIAVMWKLL